MKKILISLSCMIVILIGAGFSYQQYNNNKKAEAEAQMKKEITKYNKIVNSFYDNSQQVNNNANEILDDYSRFWRLGLGHGTMFSMVNSSKKINQSKANETEATLNDTKNDLKLIAKAANKYPEKYKEIYTECKKIYSINSALMKQVKEPSGSYITFNQSVNELGQQFDSENGLLETLLP